MLTNINERYECKLFKRLENSPYEYEQEPSITFRCRPATRQEKNEYRLQAGVHTTTDSVYLVSSNLPENIKDGDKVLFKGQLWIVASVGYYFDENILVNASLMSDKYIEERCPKGITLK